MPKKIEKKRINKSAFVRSLPASTTAAQAVEAAKKKGIDLDEKYFYNIRSKAKSNGSTPKRVGRPSKAAKYAVTTGYADVSEAAFLETALNIGLNKAESLLKNLKDKIQEAMA